MLDHQTTSVRIASPGGPVTRKVLRTPLRDALPSEIPIIDVSTIFSSSVADRQNVARQVNDAATNMGFFYIKNHGIPSSLIQDINNAALRFYRQSPEKKLEADVAQSAHYNGYRAPNTLSLNPDEGIDVREAFSFTYDPRLDPQVASWQEIPAPIMEHIGIEHHHFSATAQIPGFKDAVVAYFQACLALARALTRTFALSLGLPETAFDSKVVYPDATLNMNYYPPIIRSPPADGNTRVSIGSHTDFQLFTILWQDAAGGLQVLNRDGQWINAKPIPGTFVVNIADCLQRITNDKYVSTIHRAQNWSGRERISLAFFWGFGLHEKCQVLDNCVAPGSSKKYEDIQCSEWLRQRVRDMTQLGED
ncbi:2OG-Fe(II) oxygenase [Moelleriella libera RCEF 2490]|uniref:2OG-Fe(II) oxygenase n=1 Tax=Moelleriella libera RCEF 2490 TaxID=1081109 RepID=A0A166UFU5_9HYPO|nr:2OG-Fe(II) oxygenase [Moelleriella libera RCEF 2490]